MNIGEKIRERRLMLKMTQEELANKIGYKSKSSINKIELAKTMPIKKVEKIAHALDCEPSYLMGWDDDTDRNINSQSAMLDADLIIKYAKLTPVNKKIVSTIINIMLSNQDG